MLPIPRSQVAPRTVVVVVFTLLAIVAGLYLLWRLNEILQWLIIAIFLAVALAPPVDWLSRRRLPRVLAILLVYVVLLLALAGLGALLLPPLIDQVEELGSYLVGLARAPGGFDQTVEELASRYGLSAYVASIREQLSSLPARLAEAARPLLALTAGLVGSVAAVASVLLLTFFLLLDFDLIPLVGSTIGSTVVILVALLVDPVKALILAGYFVLYQQVENNVLQPLVYGRSVRLHPLVIFLAVLAGGELLGILGALLAIPVAEVIRILGAEWLASRRSAQDLPPSL